MTHASCWGTSDNRTSPAVTLPLSSTNSLHDCAACMYFFLFLVNRKKVGLLNLEGTGQKFLEKGPLLYSSHRLPPWISSASSSHKLSGGVATALVAVVEVAVCVCVFAAVLDDVFWCPAVLALACFVLVSADCAPSAQLAVKSFKCLLNDFAHRVSCSDHNHRRGTGAGIGTVGRGGGTSAHYLSWSVLPSAIHMHTHKHAHIHVHKREIV